MDPAHEIKWKISQKDGQNHNKHYLCVIMKIKDGFKGSMMTILSRQQINELANDSFTKDLFITHIGYFPHAEHHYRQRDEGLDEYVLLCCTAGKGWIKYSETEVTLQAGHAFIIPAGYGHVYGADEKDPWTIYWVHFKGDKAPVYADTLKGTIPFSIESVPGSPVALFREMLAEFAHGQTGRYASMILHHLLGSLVHYREHGNKDTEKNAVVEKCRDYIMRNFAVDITLDDIVKVSGVSATQCGKLFKAHCGMTPMAYLASLRIAEACRLLELTTLSVKQISAMVGIPDQYYFSRLFTKHMGKSPRAYRLKTFIS